MAGAPGHSSHVIYVLVEITETHDGLGCLPILVLLAVALVIVLMSGGKL